MPKLRANRPHARVRQPASHHTHTDAVIGTRAILSNSASRSTSPRRAAEQVSSTRKTGCDARSWSRSPL
jgi:hypothetical protein